MSIKCFRLMNVMNTSSKPVSCMSFVVPVLNQEDVVNFVYEAIRDKMKDFEGSWEVVFLDNDSGDGTWDMIQHMAARYSMNVRSYRIAERKKLSEMFVLGHDLARGEVVIPLQISSMPSLHFDPLLKEYIHPDICAESLFDSRMSFVDLLRQWIGGGGHYTYCKAGVEESPVYKTQYLEGRLWRVLSFVLWGMAALLVVGGASLHPSVFAWGVLVLVGSGLAWWRGVVVDAHVRRLMKKSVEIEVAGSIHAHLCYPSLKVLDVERYPLSVSKVS